MDFLRGVSAVVVCAGHLRAVMFVDYVDLEQSSVLSQLFYFLTSLGHEAVMVFFVLSGFFVGGSVLSKRNKFGFDSYLIARLSRLWTVLFPALIFTLLVDSITGWMYPDILAGGHYEVLTSGPEASYSISWQTFLANIAFLQTVHFPVFGSNGPLWSLTNEFWYYILFPLMMMILGVVRASLTKRAVALVVTFAAIYFVAEGLLGGYLIWLLGIPVYLLYRSKPLKVGAWFPILSGFLFLISLAHSKALFFGEHLAPYADFIVGLCFSLFLVSLRNVEEQQWVEKFLAKVSYWLSDVSYTLYVFHFPLMILIYGMFYRDGQLSPTPFAMLQFFGWLTAIVLLSRLLWLTFENNTQVVRGWFLKVRDGFVNRS